MILRTASRISRSKKRRGPRCRGPLTTPTQDYTAMIKESTGLIVPIIEDIPEQLSERPQWVRWCCELREGKPTKVPYVPGTARRASSTDLMTWATFSEARAAYEAGKPMAFKGLGFVFCSADPFVGIDLDDCRDPNSGEISPWAQEIVNSVQEGYAEISPSGHG